MVFSILKINVYLFPSKTDMFLKRHSVYKNQRLSNNNRRLIMVTITVYMYNIHLYYV